MSAPIVRLRGSVAQPDAPLSDRDRAFIGRLGDRLKALIGPEFAIATVADFRDRYMDTILIGGDGAGGSGQASLTLVGIDATYASKQARLTVNAIEQVLAERARFLILLQRRLAVFAGQRSGFTTENDHRKSDDEDGIGSDADPCPAPFAECMSRPGSQRGHPEQRHSQEQDHRLLRK